jgi:hypothetical protein
VNRAFDGKEKITELRQRNFAVVFSASFSTSYLLADMYKLPVFSYYPATSKITLGWSASNMDDGPAMYWYGWLLSSLIVAFILSWMATLLPEKFAQKIPLSIAWTVPIALVPIFLYTLKFYWR